MTETSELGACRHCDHWPVHSSARWCPACGGIAPYIRTPPKKNRNWIVAVAGVLFLTVLGAAAYMFGG